MYELEACSGHATSGCRGQWRGNRAARPVPLQAGTGVTQGGQVTSGEEVRIRAPKREKQVRIEHLEGQRNLLGCKAWVVLLWDRGSQAGTCAGHAGLISPRAIGSNDGSEPLKWSDNLPADPYAFKKFSISISFRNPMTAAAPPALRKAAPFARQQDSPREHTGAGRTGQQA